MKLTTAVRSRFPFQANIYNKRHSNPFCGGALLTENYVITGATCFFEGLQDIHNMYIGLYDYKISDLNDGQEKYEIERVIMHESYRVDNDQVLHNDIALVPTHLAF